MAENSEFTSSLERADQDLERAMHDADRDLGRTLEAMDQEFASAGECPIEDGGPSDSGSLLSGGGHSPDGGIPSRPLSEGAADVRLTEGDNQSPLLSDAMPSSEQPLIREESVQDSASRAAATVENEFLQTMRLVAENAEAVSMGLQMLEVNDLSQLPHGSPEIGAMAIEGAARMIVEKLDQRAEKKVKDMQAPYRE